MSNNNNTQKYTPACHNYVGRTQTCFPGNLSSLICMTLIYLMNQQSALFSYCVGHKINIDVVTSLKHKLSTTLGTPEVRPRK